LPELFCPPMRFTRSKPDKVDLPKQRKFSISSCLIIAIHPKSDFRNIQQIDFKNNRSPNFNFIA